MLAVLSCVLRECVGRAGALIPKGHSVLQLSDCGPLRVFCAEALSHLLSYQQGQMENFLFLVGFVYLFSLCEGFFVLVFNR